VKARIEFKIATMMHAILHERESAYLSNIVNFNSTEKKTSPSLFLCN